MAAFPQEAAAEALEEAVEAATAACLAVGPAATVAAVVQLLWGGACLGATGGRDVVARALASAAGACSRSETASTRFARGVSQ